MLRFYLLLTALMGVSCWAQAQEPITVAEQQYLLERAKSRVRNYTSHLELIAQTKKGNTEERAAYKQVIFLTAAKDGAATRVFNDLVPPQVLLQDHTIERTVQLDPYIKSIAEFYKEGLGLTYSNLKTSDVYFSQADSWYFVKVTADRRVNGVYQHGNQSTRYSIEDQVDFFVSGYRINNVMRISGIYGVQPHNARDQYVKARVIMGDNDPPMELVSKPLRVKEEAIANKLKRGKDYRIAWEGGLKDDIVQVELVARDTTRNKTRLIVPMLNAGYYLFRPSANEKLGEYSFKITNLSSGRPPVMTKPFNVVRPVPLAVSVSGMGIAAGVLATFVIPKPTESARTIADPPRPR
jgi:hypothetical protein